MMKKWFVGSVATATILIGVLMLSDVPAAAQVILNILSPRGDIFVPPVTPISARLSSLAGKKIGILNNSKAGADAFQPYLEKALKEAIPDLQFRTWGIPFNVYPGKDKDLKAMAEWSDAVIGILGD